MKFSDISVGVFASSFLPQCVLNATKLSWLEIFQMILKCNDNFSFCSLFGICNTVLFSSGVCKLIFNLFA